MNFARLSCLAVVAFAALCSPSFAEQGPVVQAPAGALLGVVEGGANVFRGIPYALPPIGPARWTPPQTMPTWKTIRAATEFGPVCYQPVAKLANIYADTPPSMSEDCLYLNVWAPKAAKNAPVLVWIHGGALLTGWSNEAIYDGAQFAKRGIILVSINYRLGVLGWLAHPELSAESQTKVSGNYGLLDQIAALQWVKRNIGAFGGDPSNVTIAGESSGGLSVMYLLASPPARGLFAKAIAESAYMISTPALRERQYGETPAEENGTKLAAELNAKSIADLRAMDAGKLTIAAIMARFAPFGTIDGQILPAQLVDVFDKGQQAPVPLLAGFNSGEIRSLRVLAPPVPASPADYQRSIDTRYGDLADDFLKLYPATNLQESIWATTRDALYGWTAERLVRKQTALGQPAYLYFFDHSYPAEDTGNYHAFHGSELPFVFGTADRTPPQWPKIPATPAEQSLSDAMVDYWSSFARSGQPTAANAPAWQPYGTTAAYMHFGDAPHVEDHLLPGMYKLNEEVVCRRRAKGDLPWNWNVGLVSPPLPPQSANCQ
jgi:para-nitrobenzyl esterase